MSYRNSITCQIKTLCGTMYVHFVFDKNDKLIRVIPNLGKAGTCARAHLSSFAELVNQMLVFLPKDKCILLINNVAGHKCQGNELTCIDLLCRAIVETLMPKIYVDD